MALIVAGSNFLLQKSEALEWMLLLQSASDLEMKTQSELFHVWLFGFFLCVTYTKKVFLLCLVATFAYIWSLLGARLQ